MREISFSQSPTEKSALNFEILFELLPSCCFSAKFVAIEQVQVATNMGMKDFKVVGNLGKGAFAAVSKVRCHQ